MDKCSEHQTNQEIADAHLGLFELPSIIQELINKAEKEPTSIIVESPSDNTQQNLLFPKTSGGYDYLKPLNFYKKNNFLSTSLDNSPQKYLDEQKRQISLLQEILGTDLVPNCLFIPVNKKGNDYEDTIFTLTKHQPVVMEFISQKYQECDSKKLFDYLKLNFKEVFLKNPVLITDLERIIKAQKEASLLSPPRILDVFGIGNLSIVKDPTTQTLRLKYLDSMDAFPEENPNDTLENRRKMRWKVYTKFLTFLKVQNTINKIKGFFPTPS